jgi:hypothetical protein
MFLTRAPERVRKPAGQVVLPISGSASLGCSCLADEKVLVGHGCGLYRQTPWPETFEGSYFTIPLSQALDDECDVGV